VYLYLERYEEAFEMLASALPAARALADRHTEGHLCSAMGEACSRLARDENATACHYNALVIAEELGDHELLGTVLNNLGRHYLRIDTDKAEMCHQRALAIACEAGNPGLEAESLFEMGVLMAESGRTAAARTALSRALALAAGIGEHRVEEKVRDVLDALPSN
jgi:tetratricopeptide (TPR) repeat protein